MGTVSFYMVAALSVSIGLSLCNRSAHRVFCSRWSLRTSASDPFSRPSHHKFRNKWVLKVTDVPLFFLFMQLIIATVLFIAAHLLGVLVVPLRLEWEVVKGLRAMIGLNVLGLRRVRPFIS